MAAVAHKADCSAAWADVGSAELYSGAGFRQLGVGITEARQPAYLRQHRLSGQAASDPQFTDVGVDLVHPSS